MARNTRSKGDIPPAKRDAQGECLHLYLTRDAKCVHCGMQFRLAWTASRSWLAGPLRRNLNLGIGGILGMGVSFMLGVELLGFMLLLAGVHFIVRGLLGTIEVFLRHGFVPGKLGGLEWRGRFNLWAMKPLYAYVGSVRFPMDEQAYKQFAPGETLLVEHLRWSRLPVAVYRGHPAQ